MSTSPTSSVSSGQTRYYDAVVMHFPRPDDADREGTAPGALNNAHQPSLAKGAVSSVEDEAGRKTPSLRSLPTEDSEGKQTPATTTGSALARRASVRTTASARTTTSAFANGAPLVGASAKSDVDEHLLVRGANAERTLNQKQMDRISKEEKRESMKFSRLLKTESTTEKVALDSALKTLSSLQSLYKAAIRRESKADASHAKALSAAQEAESKYHEEKARTNEVRARMEARCAEERARWEGKEGQVRAQQERLTSARETVQEMEARITDCAREVERLRIIKATDEREREAKLIGLTGQK